MSFRIGQDVYVGWCPSSSINGEDPRCRVATIIDGPYDDYQEPWMVIPGRSWGIRHDNGVETVTDERLLSPFEPPAETTETEIEVTA